RRPRHCRTRGRPVLCPAGGGHRPDPGQSAGEPLPDRLHQGPRPRRCLLAVPAHPQTGPHERDHPGRPGRAGSPSWKSRSTPMSGAPTGFGGRQVRAVTRALPCGDYGLVADSRLIASVERKSLADLVTSLTSGKLRYALAELAALPRAAVVVEDRYSQVFKLERVRPALVADGLANCRSAGPTSRSSSA